MRSATDGCPPTRYPSIFPLSTCRPAIKLYQILSSVKTSSYTSPSALSFTTRWTHCWRLWRGRCSGFGSLPPWLQRWRRSGSSWQSTEPRDWSWTNCCQASPPSAPAARSSSAERLMTTLLLRVSDSRMKLSVSDSFTMCRHKRSRQVTKLYLLFVAYSASSDEGLD